MRKRTVLILGLTLTAMLIFQSIVFAGSSSSVTQTSANVIVNGELTGFEAYNIGGNNYFKLRDISLAVSGTEKQFEVSWDETNRAINLLSTTKYTPVGGELALGDGKTKQAILNQAPIYKDGNLVQLTAYTIGGNNFFKLRDLTQTFNIGVEWDDVTKTIGINTSKPYVAPPVVEPVVQPGVGNWYTPKYQDAFATYTVVSFSEGFFLGNVPLANDTEFTRIAIYDAQMKMVKQTDYTLGNRSRPPIFSDGLMCVTRPGQLYGYCDTTGKEVIPCIYYEASNFLNGVALVHQDVNGQPKTMVINKKNEILLSWDALYYGDLRPYAIYIDEADPLTEDWHEGYGWYYDFNCRPITIANRSNTWDKYGYYDELGTRRDVTRYDRNEETAFLGKYGSQYEEIKYQGGGFFLVQPKGQPDMKGIVDKNNKVILPMQAGEVEAAITETDAIFTCDAGVYNQWGKLIISFAKARYGVVSIGNGGLLITKDTDTWGLCTLTGEYILPLSSKPLAHIGRDGYVYASGDWYVNAPQDNITFYTTANMQVRGDTTELKALFAKATAYKKTADYSQSHPYAKKQFDTAYANAKNLLASSNPIWIDIHSAKVNLSCFVVQ